jgi:hypothetical protein
MAQTVGAHILERLHGHGVRRVYGYPGDGINGILGGFHEHGDRIEFIQAAHEELVVSELVTNSLRHSGTPAGASVIVGVALTPDTIRLDVEDTGHRGAIAPRPVDPETSGGFGLNLVEALSERWGMERVRAGTRVWVQLPRAPRDEVRPGDPA